MTKQNTYIEKNSIFECLEEENEEQDNPFLFQNDYLEKISLNNDFCDQNILSLTQEIGEFNKSNNEKENIEIPKNNTNKFIIEKNIYKNEKRKDYILKSFKVKSGRYLRNLLNQNKLRLKFYSLNSKEFTSNINYNENSIWMKWKLEKIIQYKNEKNSNVLKKLCSKSKKNKEEFEKINNFLQMTYRDFLIKYYIEQFNKDFINNEAYKLLKSLGFFKIMSTKGKKKNIYKKGKNQ